MSARGYSLHSVCLKLFFFFRFIARCSTVGFYPPGEHLLVRRQSYHVSRQVLWPWRHGRQDEDLYSHRPHSHPSWFSTRYGLLVAHLRLTQFPYFVVDNYVDSVNFVKLTPRTSNLSNCRSSRIGLRGTVDLQYLISVVNVVLVEFSPKSNKIGVQTEFQVRGVYCTRKRKIYSCRSK